MRRALVAATLAAAAILPIGSAHAEPICAFHPICDDIAEILERVGHGGGHG